MSSVYDYNLLKFPKLAVFDLDYTLWPFWIDTHVTPPFKKVGNKVVDARGATIKYYPEVPEMLKYLKDNNCLIAIASRTAEIQGARQLIELFGWEKYFDYKEIFPGQKTTHFSNLRKASGIDYQDMVFYDDEERNSRDVSPLGVTCVLVEDGMSRAVLNKGLALWATKHQGPN